MFGISLTVPETLAATAHPWKRSYETYFSMSFVKRLVKRKPGIWHPRKKPSPALTERKEKRKFYNVSVARGIVYLIYSEFKAGREFSQRL